MNLQPLLRPRTIAVFGGRYAAEVIRQNDRIGFTGDIWPVHPRLDAIEGRPVFRSVADLPAAPDAAFIAVNRHQTIDIVAALRDRGAGGAIAFASGFSEVADGAGLQAALKGAAGDMPVLGPNCYGLLNYADGALLWPDQHGGRPVQRGVAILTQSGNIACNLTQQQRGLPIAYVVTLGNQAIVGMGTVLDALLEDDRVTAIGLHIEGIEDPDALAAAVDRGGARGVFTVAVKTGGSESGARLTVSHTASLAGGDAVAGAFLRRMGAARVKSLPELLETLKLLHVHGTVRSSGIACLSCSGGEAALIADRAAEREILIPPLTEEHKAEVAATTAPLVTVSNPLDYHTFHWGNGPALRATFTAMMDGGFAMTVLILDLPRADRCDITDWRTALDAFVAAHDETGASAAVIATLPELLPEAVAGELIAAGVVPFLGIEEALAALEAGRFLGLTLPPEEPPLIGAGTVAGPIVQLDEWRGKRALAAYGMTLPAGKLVGSPPEATKAAAALGFPVVLKAVGASIAHKSEVGGVRLDLRTPAAVTAAAVELMGLSKTLLVERMVTDGVAEIIVGAARDPRLGPYLVVGSGGVLAELIGDRAVLVLPAQRGEVDLALSGLKAWKLIDGYRGRRQGDLDALIDTVMAVQRYVMDNVGRIAELDLNPVIVRPRGQGVVVADALIRLHEPPKDGEPKHG